jgi:hypothetical protein
MGMVNIYAERQQEAAFGGGFADEGSWGRDRGQADGAATTQTAEVTPTGDPFAKNWVIAALILFVFLYTVSRLLD